MNAVEIEQAVSILAETRFDAMGFPYAFLEAFGNKETTLKRLRSGNTNQSDLTGGVLQRNNIHIKVCPEGEVTATLKALRESPATSRQKAKYILATDGKTLESERLIDGETLACEYSRFPDRFTFFLPLAGISTVKQIDESAFDIRATKGAGADPTASEATRVSGSLNFKEKYAPGYPRVQITYANSGRLVTRPELEALGIAAKEEEGPSVHQFARRRRGASKWPDYNRCVEKAPQARGEQRPDISHADFTFCLLAIDWGRSIEEAAARLLQESGKARENGEAYATVGLPFLAIRDRSTGRG